MNEEGGRRRDLDKRREMREEGEWMRRGMTEEGLGMTEVE